MRERTDLARKKKKDARREGRSANLTVVMTCASEVRVGKSGKLKVESGTEPFQVPLSTVHVPALARRSVANAVLAAETFATGDLADRAHSLRVPDKDFPEGRLVGAARVGGATPRRYHRAYMHEVVEGRLQSETLKVESGNEEVTVRIVERAVAIVSDETVFDETFETLVRLSREGLDVFGTRSARDEFDDAVWGKHGVALRGVMRRRG